MKRITVAMSVFAALMSFGSVAAQECSGLSGCEAKVCQIEKQIELAKQHNNSNKEAGLQKALAEVKDHCTVDGLKDDLQDDIDNVMDDLAEHQDDLAEAIQDEELDKVEKYKQKIAEDKQELEELKAELQKLYTQST
ncbi:DUF1090 domain-containing protein [Vibrio algivorus]|nr:DUF1090 domain-containing protein [Vibrio algivorus]